MNDDNCLTRNEPKQSFGFVCKEQPWVLYVFVCCSQRSISAGEKMNQIVTFATGLRGADESFHLNQVGPSSPPSPPRVPRYKSCSPRDDTYLLGASSSGSHIHSKVKIQLLILLGVCCIFSQSGLLPYLANNGDLSFELLFICLCSFQSCEFWN
jgi:hypothetical protein